MTQREEVATGLQLLTEMFKLAGLRVRETRRPWPDRSATYVVFGIEGRDTDLVISDEYLSDLPNTREYKGDAERYAGAIAGRVKYGSPEDFYCRSSIPISLEIQWPIHTVATSDRGLVSWLMVTVTNRLDDLIAICSLQIPAFEYPTPSPFLRAEQIVNRVRDAIDKGSVEFVPRGAHSSNGQIIEYTPAGERRQISEEEVERFLVGKAYDMGFRAAHKPLPIWVPDPWDANYLGTTTRALSQAAHILQARKLLTISGDYASSSDKLLSEGPDGISERTRKSQQISLSTLPSKEKFESYVTDQLQKGAELGLIFVDLDHFKNVNDTQGHQAGDACLERVVQTMGAAIGGKGTLYRWGGDEFAVCLPDFSTEEAAATAERLRRSIEDSKAGGSVAVTASIGVCATDHTTSASPTDLIESADEAMYSSKKSGKNRVTIAGKTAPKAIAPKFQRRPL